MCTKEDMTELKRCVHLMKKGYEVQKLSVINNIERYLKEPGANDELFSIIIDSMLDWDTKMQKECASSFISPLQAGLVDKKNSEKVAVSAVTILIDRDNWENQELLDYWFQVLEVVVGQVDIKFVSSQVIAKVKDLPAYKNEYEVRKMGNRLVLTIANGLGELGFDKDPCLWKLVMGICEDSNYNLRRDGVIFFKEYISKRKEEFLLSDRL